MQDLFLFVQILMATIHITVEMSNTGKAKDIAVLKQTWPNFTFRPSTYITVLGGKRTLVYIFNTLLSLKHHITEHLGEVHIPLHRGVSK